MYCLKVVRNHDWPELAKPGMMAFRTPMFIDEQHRGTRSKYGSSNHAKALKCLSF